MLLALEEIPTTTPITETELSFLMMRVGMSVMCFTGDGFGTKRIPCIIPKIAPFSTKDSDAPSSGDLMCSTLSGDGNLRTATCPGLKCFFFNCVLLLFLLRFAQISFLLRVPDSMRS